MKEHVAVGLLAMVLLVWGCEPERTLVPRMEPLPSDVPVPTTFKFDPADSTDFASQSTKERYSNYHYTGRAYFVDVVDFYKRQMPIDGWQLQQDADTGGRKMLYYKKAGADPTKPETPTCIVTIFASGEIANAIRIFRTEK